MFSDQTGESSAVYTGGNEKVPRGYQSNHHHILIHLPIPVSISGHEEWVVYACCRRLSFERHICYLPGKQLLLLVSNPGDWAC